VIERYAPELRRLVMPGGVLIVSGFAPEELSDVGAALGVSPAGSQTEGEWAAAMMRV
jgi:hypothetical protein